jgi:hypothetical protein
VVQKVSGGFRFVGGVVGFGRVWFVIGTALVQGFCAYGVFVGIVCGRVTFLFSVSPLD